MPNTIALYMRRDGSVNVAQKYHSYEIKYVTVVIQKPEQDA